MEELARNQPDIDEVLAQMKAANDPGGGGREGSGLSLRDRAGSTFAPTSQLLGTESQQFGVSPVAVVTPRLLRR